MKTHKNMLVLLLSLFVVICNAQQWQPVGFGMNSTVTALVRYNGTIIAGGTFTQADGNTTIRVAEWNGVTWNSFGNFNEAVLSLCIYNGELYAGGRFTVVGGVPVSHIAKYDGTNWVEVGGGINDEVRSLYVFNNQLYVGGSFVFAGGLSNNCVVAWDGIAWISLGSGIVSMIPNSAVVIAICNFQNKLYFGGYFTNSGSITTQNIACWDGVNWIDPSPSIGANNNVLSLAVHNNKLYVAGEFSQFDGISSPSIISFDGSNWTPVSVGLNMRVLSMTSCDGKLYASGAIIPNGGQTVGYIGAWDGIAWQQVDTNINNSPYVLYNDTIASILYAGGNFTNVAGSGVGNYVAQFYYGAPLPVTLVDFTAKCENEFVVIRWSTESEVNNSHFILERSLDGENFDLVATCPGNGTTSEMHRYEYLDTFLPESTLYYRLVQYDNDGAFEYFGPIVTQCSDRNSIAFNYFFVESTLSIFVKHDDVLRIISVGGQIVFETIIHAGKTQISTESMPAGLYCAYVGNSKYTFVR
jgi:hypothetical protein